MAEHTATPWTDRTALAIPPGDDRVKLGGYPSKVAIRVLSEGNYQYAKHCINAHDDLVAACKLGLRSAGMPPHSKSTREAMRIFTAALALAEEQSP